MRRRSIGHRIAAGALTLVAAGIALLEFRIVGDIIDHAIIGDFYAQPAPAPTGAPGTLARIQSLPGAPIGAQAWRVLYHSTDLSGAPTIVSGLVVAPAGPAPEAGRTVVSWAHPTTGTAPQCAPSRGNDPFLSIEGLRVLLDRGWVVTYTDYTGMGTAGRDSYLIGETAGRNVLDAIRAAQEISEAQAGDEVVLWGHSQGGQAALFAAEGAADYAPELEVRAVAVAAPAANLTALLDADIGDISGVTIAAYAFPAFADVYSDTVPGAELETILTPAGLAAVDEMNSLCLFSGNERLHEIAAPLVGDFLLHDPATTAPWDELLAENSAGRVAFDAPLYVAQGLQDTLVVPKDTAEFVAHERLLGVEVHYEEVGWADHGTIAYAALPSLAAWLDDVMSAR